jgi:hypothetical protein
VLGERPYHCPTVIDQQDPAPLPTIGKKLLKCLPGDTVDNDVVLFQE